jgi:hypothetical protein
MTASMRARVALTAARGLLALCALTAAIGAWRTGRHARVSELASTTTAAGLAAPSVAPSAREATLDVLLGRDPFDASRLASRRPYRIAAEAERVVQPVATPSVRLLGTVVLTGGRSFALCQLDGGAARVVYPGEMIGALRLVRVDQGSAVFTDAAGARIELLVPRSDGGRNDR